MYIMYMYMYMYLYLYVYVYVYVYAYVYVYVMYVHMYLYLCPHLYLCLYMCVYIMCIYILYAYIITYTRICAYTYIGLHGIELRVYRTRVCAVCVCVRTREVPKHHPGAPSALPKGPWAVRQKPQHIAPTAQLPGSFGSFSRSLSFKTKFWVWGYTIL